MPLKHRIERITDKLALAIERQSETLAEGYRGGSDVPPYSQKLTKREQLEQYLALDEQKWGAMIQERGLHETIRYRDAMRSLAAKVLGTDGSPSDPMVIGPEPKPAEIDVLSGQPLQMVNPGTVSAGMAQTAEQEQQQAMDPTRDVQSPVSTEQILQQALAQAGFQG